jgi:hypothetical protein
MIKCDVCGEEYHPLDLHYIGGGLNIEVCEECIRTPKKYNCTDEDDLMPKELIFDYNRIDTSMAQKHSDERLLGAIMRLPVVSISGWGLIAELCKRYEDKITN